MVSSVVVDGVSQSVSGSYLFANVTDNHSISVFSSLVPVSSSGFDAWGLSLIVVVFIIVVDFVVLLAVSKPSWTGFLAGLLSLVICSVDLS